MTLQVPDKLAAQAECTTPELIFGLVVGLFYQGRLSLGQAGEALGLSKPGFMQRLHEMGLPMPYSAEDASRDLEAINRHLASESSSSPRVIVVSDTTALTSLIKAGMEHILPRLFGKVRIPQAVAGELLRFHT